MSEQECSARKLQEATQTFYNKTVNMTSVEQLYPLLDRENFSGRVRYIGIKFDNAETFAQFALSLQRRAPDIENEILAGKIHNLGRGLVRLDAPHRARVYRTDPRSGQRELRLIFHSKIRFTYVGRNTTTAEPPLLQTYDFVPGFGGVWPTVKLFLVRWWNRLFRN